MTFKTISLVLIADGDADSAPAIRFAVQLAGRFHAHLQAGIGIPPLIIPVDSPSPGAVAMYEEENRSLRSQAARLGDLIRSEAELAGTMAKIEIFSQAYDPLAPHLLHMARTGDVCVAMAAQPGSNRQHDILVSLLMGSGVPVMIIPPTWEKFSAIDHVTLGWDGSSQSTRAMRDALPVLQQAQSVEIVSIVGEKALEHQLAGSDIAPHLARHCRNVTSVELPVQGGSVANTLFEHARLTRADLVVMGCYGHSRLREFIFGGATREVLAQTIMPVLMSH